MDLYSELWALFKPVKVWTQLETQARDGYSLLLYLLAASFPGASAPAPVHGIYLPFCLGLHGVLLARVLTGRTLFLPRRRELELKELIKGNLRSTPVVSAERTEDMGRMKRLYERVIALMEQKRPFLDEEFSLDDLAGAVFSNRAYLSKTINILSGRNFSQFVNCFRIRYSVELLRKDPTLRLIDVAMMSGFHTTVTFNMAFKLNMGETPSRFQERLRVERAKARPSRIPEQAP